ncbi:hypothetical protein HD554DRAFT_2315632 [Boletus coccyginus]|nr:hypothetical protein HD554DRAFT_2315632 [Boletus coccyginus]
MIRNQPARTFFGQDLPATLAGVDPEFVNGTLPGEAENDETHHLLLYPDLASKVNDSQERAIDDFAKDLLRMLNFEERDCVLRSHSAIPLLICGEATRTIQTNICLVRHSFILLIVQEDKTLSAKDPEPQVIAGAVAAFQLNNRNRCQLGMDRKDSMSIPCIRIVGTRPIFYVVPVTKELTMAVEMGQYPEHLTEVRRCVVGEEKGRVSEGMEQLDFRLEALKHYILFRSLAKSLWSDFFAD